jgi:hypothetical protein
VQAEVESGDDAEDDRRRMAQDLEEGSDQVTRLTQRRRPWVVFLFVRMSRCNGFLE